MHAAEPWTYRNRARLRMQGAEIGYSRRASNDFLPIEECPIVSTLLSRTAFLLRDLVRKKEVQWPFAASSMELFANAEESELQLTLQLDATVTTVDREAPRALRTLCERVRSEVPELAGAGLSVAATPDARQTRRMQESQRMEIARWGQSWLTYHVNGQAYRVTRGAFFQVNRYLTATMQDLVTRGHRGTLAYDLFAGAGLFSVPLTKRFEQVVAVEIGEPAATDLAAHLRACGPKHRAIRDTALGFLQRQLSSNQQPDIIVLDPPRAGLGAPLVRALLQTDATKIVYVSCDASTFARDAKALVESGYKLETLHLLDLFPQTFHTETIAVLRR